MAGVYSRNRLFDKYYNHGMEKLPILQDEVSADRAVKTTAFDDYETALEDGWPDFIMEFYVD